MMHVLREQEANLQSQHSTIMSTLRKEDEMEAQQKTLDEREKRIVALEKDLMENVEAEMRTHYWSKRGSTGYCR